MKPGKRSQKIDAEVITNPGSENEQKYTAVFLPKQPSKRGKFIMIFYEPFNDLILVSDLASADIKFFHKMAALMNQDNVCEQSVTALCDELELSLRIGFRCVRRLQEIHAIHPVKNMGRTIFYMLNPNLVSKVGEKHQRILIQRWNILFQLEEPKLEIVKNPSLNKTKTKKKLNKDLNKTSSGLPY